MQNPSPLPAKLRRQLDQALSGRRFREPVRVALGLALQEPEESLRAIAARVRVHPGTLHEALRSTGLHEPWKARRKRAVGGDLQAVPWGRYFEDDAA